MHVGSYPWQRSRKVTCQSAQGLVPQSGLGQCQGRHRYIPSKEAAARFYCVACLRIFARLPVSRLIASDAAASHRYRSLQIRILQAERIDQTGAQRAVLEAGTSLSRRYRMDDNFKPLYGHSCFHRRELRSDISVRGYRAADEEHESAGTGGYL